jgi:chromosome segregation ATPase
MAEIWGTPWGQHRVGPEPGFLRRRPTLCAALLCALILPGFLCGCQTIPDNAVKLSAIQMQHLEQYRTSVQSVIDSCRKDAEGLMAERGLGYMQLIQRGEDLHKELYRVTSRLLSRTPIPAESPRFQESLADNDRWAIQQVEGHVNRRIERYLAASSVAQIDKEALVRAKEMNNEAEIHKILDPIPEGTLKKDIQSFLSSTEPFDKVRPLLVKRIDELNETLRAENPDIARLGNDVEFLIGRIDKLEAVLDRLRTAQSDYREKANKAMGELNARLKDLESAGDIVVATQKDLHGTLQRVKSIDVQAVDILTNIHPLIESLGTAGVVKSEEANAINEILNSVNDLLKNRETENG